MTGTEWGEWDALPGENPDDCLRSQNADHITQISNVITPGAISDGAITDGAVTGSDHRRRRDGRCMTDGAITPVGAPSAGVVTSVGLSTVTVTFTGKTPNVVRVLG